MMNEAFEQHKVCVLIPTYNNNQTLENVLQDVMRFTTHIIVVNDGSTDNTADILAKYPSIRTVQYANNQARATRFAWVLRKPLSMDMIMRLP